jgi:hypothetical protein
MKPVVNVKKVGLRQGDVLLIPTQAIQGIPKKSKIVAEGEITGHHHQFGANAAVNLYVTPDVQFAEVQEDSVLIHPEHENLMVPAGTYEIHIARERTFNDLIEKVRD